MSVLRSPLAATVLSTATSVCTVAAPSAAAPIATHGMVCDANAVVIDDTTVATASSVAFVVTPSVASIAASDVASAEASNVVSILALAVLISVI